MNAEHGMSLYTIDDTISQLIILREEATTDEERVVIDGQIEEWIGRELCELQRSDGCYGLIRHEEQQAAMAYAVEVEASKWRSIHRDRAERVRDMVKAVMEKRGVKKVEGAVGSFMVRANGGVRPMEPVNESKVPDEYRIFTLKLSAHLWKALQIVVTHSADGAYLLRMLLSVLTTSVDISAVRKALEAGEEVPGAKLGERGTNLT